MTDETKEVIVAIEKQGERFERNIEKLSGQTSDMASSINQLVSFLKYQPSPSQDRRGNGKNGNGIWPILFGVGALIFGLLAPLYIMVQGVDKHIGSLKIELLAHGRTTGHIGAMEKHATASERFKEVETQFNAMEKRVEGIENWNLWRLKKNHAGGIQ